MKIQNLVLRLIIVFVIGVVFIVLIMMLFPSCSSQHSGTPGTLQLKADIPRTHLKSGRLTAVGGVTITLKSAQIEIQNLRVKVNSDLKNRNEVQPGNDRERKDAIVETGNLCDSLLTGPYVLDILSCTAPIDEVLIKPGTYKKVDFEFFAGPDNRGHSISISGIFSNEQGASIPFILTSEYAKTIQLSLSGNGLKVKPGKILSLTILFDLNNWLNKLDFSAAHEVNGQINITKDENKELYKEFLTQLPKNIDVEIAKEN